MFMADIQANKTINALGEAMGGKKTNRRARPAQPGAARREPTSGVTRSGESYEVVPLNALLANFGKKL